MVIPDLCIISCGSAKTRTATSAHRLYPGMGYKAQAMKRATRKDRNV